MAIGSGVNIEPSFSEKTNVKRVALHRAGAPVLAMWGRMHQQAVPNSRRWSVIPCLTVRMLQWCEVLHVASLDLGLISKRSEFPVRIKPSFHHRILPPPPQWAATIHFLPRLISRVYILILSSPLGFGDFSTYSEPLKSSLYIYIYHSTFLMGRYTPFKSQWLLYIPPAFTWGPLPFTYVVFLFLVFSE